MNRNQKTVWLSLIGAIVLLVVVSLIFVSWKKSRIVHCPDGTNHPMINAEQFATDYTGYSAKVQAKLTEKSDFSAEIGTQKLREMSDAMQQSRLHIQSLAAGYDACAVDTNEFNDARNRYQRMEDVAREINNINSQQPLKIAEETRIKQLVDEYIRLSRE